MKIFKKARVWLLLFLTVFAALFIFSACFGDKEGGDEEPDDSEGSESNSEIFFVSEEDFETLTNTENGYFSFSPDEAKAKSLDSLFYKKKYYALIYVKNSMLASATISPPIFTDLNKTTVYAGSDFTQTSAIFTSYNKTSGDFVIKNQSNKIVWSSYYFAVEFTLRNSIPGGECKVGFEYLTSRTGNGSEKSISKTAKTLFEKQITAKPSIGFITEADYNEGNFDSKIKETLTVGLEQKFFAIIDYELAPVNNIEETDTATVSISMELGYKPYITLGVEAFPTSDYTFDKDNLTINANVTILNTAGEGRKLRFIIYGIANSEGAYRIKTNPLQKNMSVIDFETVSGYVNADKSIKAESKLEFEEYGNGWKVVGLGGENKDEIDVPSAYKGKPVKAIASNVFSDLKYIKKITLSNGLEEICEDAFKGCTGLTSLVIPESVTSIGSGAFSGCTGIKNIIIPKKVSFIGKNAFADSPDMDIYCCAAAKPYDWHNEWVSEEQFVTWSYNDIFELSSDRKYYIFDYSGRYGVKVAVPEEYKGLPVKKIKDNAFFGCGDLKALKISTCITEIAEKALQSSTTLEYVTVSRGSSISTDSYTAVNNCLIRSGVLIWFGKQSELPTDGTVVEIGSYAFSGCSWLTEITIPAPIRSVNANAFNGCTQLKAVALPKSLTGIYTTSLAGCAALETITVDSENTTYKGAGNCVIKIDTGAVVLGCKNSVIPTDGSVKKIAENAFKGMTGLTSINIPSSVTVIAKNAFADCEKLKTVTFEANSLLTLIDEEAFTGCSALTEISIPAAVKTVAKKAFASCTNLKTVIFDEGSLLNLIDVQAFYLCYNLSNITFDADGELDTIGEESFYYCSSLKTISIPASVKIIGKSAFAGCSLLETVTFDNNSQLSLLDEQVFLRCVALKEINIPSSIVTLSKAAFSGCKGLVTVTFGDNCLLTTIGEQAFENCVALNGIAIPNSVTSIGAYAFEGSGIITLTIGEGVTTIGEGAFSNCKKLTEIKFNAKQCGDLTAEQVRIFKNAGADTDGISIIFGSGVKRVPRYLFAGERNGSYPKLTSISFGSEITNIDNYAFEYCIYISSITIPSQVTSIGIGAFEGCAGLTEINFNATNCSVVVSTGAIFYGSGVNTDGITLTFGDNVKSVPARAFTACKIKEINFGSGVEIINEYAFTECTGLSEVLIPKNIKTIGWRAFLGCPQLTKVTVAEDGQLETIKSEAFLDCTALTEITLSESITFISINVFKNTGYYNDENNWEDGVLYIGKCLVKCDEMTLNNVVIKDGTLCIAERAFEKCKYISSVTIPESIKYICDNAFTYCSGLTEINFNATEIIRYNNYTVFYGAGSSKSGITLNIGDSVKVIPNNFMGTNGSSISALPKITKLVIGKNVEYIGRFAFYNCSGINEISLPDTVTYISSESFVNTGYYKNEANWENGMLYIGKYLIATKDLSGFVSVKDGTICIAQGVFSNSYNVTGIYLPSSLTTICTSAFHNCYKMVEVINKSSLTLTIGSEDNGSVALYALKIHSGESEAVEKNGFIFLTCDGVNYLLGYNGTETNLTLPENYNGEKYEIYKYAFYYNQKIKSVVIPDNVTAIGEKAFSQSSIGSVTIGNGVKTIGVEAFSRCSSLTNVYVGTGLESVGTDAFLYCRYIRYVGIADVGSWSGIDFANPAANPLSAYGQLYMDGNVIKSLDIPDTVTKIGSYAFYNCRSLQNISITKNLTEIGEGAFEECVGVNYIGFKGNSAQWEEVTKGENWDKNVGKSTSNRYYRMQIWGK